MWYPHSNSDNMVLCTFPHYDRCSWSLLRSSFTTKGASNVIASVNSLISAYPDYFAGMSPFSVPGSRRLDATASAGCGALQGARDSLAALDKGHRPDSTVPHFLWLAVYFFGFSVMWTPS